MAHATHQWEIPGGVSLLSVHQSPRRWGKWWRGETASSKLQKAKTSPETATISIQNKSSYLENVKKLIIECLLKVLWKVVWGVNRNKSQFYTDESLNIYLKFDIFATRCYSTNAVTMEFYFENWKPGDVCSFWLAWLWSEERSGVRIGLVSCRNLRLGSEYFFVYFLDKLK